MSLEILKINKQLSTAMIDAGFSSPTEIQEKSMSRIMGGQDLIIIGPEGAGKTTNMVIGIIAKLKYAVEEAPRAMILVANKEAVLELEEQFNVLGKNTDLRVIGLYAGVGIEGQKDDIADGVDVVIGTPDRVQAIYYKSGLNLNKLKVFSIDDAELIIKQGFRTIIHQLVDSMAKCQHLVITEVVHDKFEMLTSRFLINPVTIEVEGDIQEKEGAISLVLYQVPNYKTKLNLLNLLMQNAEVFEKVIVFANTSQTIDKLYKSLSKRIEGEVGVYKPVSSSVYTINSDEEFLASTKIRVMLVANDVEQTLDISEIPCVIHFDLPEEKDKFIERVQKEELGGEEVDEEEEGERVAITFATDIELSLVKKIEHTIGQKFMVEDLPYGLIIEGDAHSKAKEKPVAPVVEEKGKAFHEKKESNAKEFNYKYMDRLKMFGKKHRKNKKMK